MVLQPRVAPQGGLGLVETRKLQTLNPKRCSSHVGSAALKASAMELDKTLRHFLCQPARSAWPAFQLEPQPGAAVPTLHISPKHVPAVALAAPPFTCSPRDERLPTVMPLPAGTSLRAIRTT